MDGAGKFKDKKIIYFAAYVKSIIQYIANYFRTIDKRVLLIVSLFTAVFIFINYQYDLDGAVRKNNSFCIKLIQWYAVFAAAFWLPYATHSLLNKKTTSFSPAFLFLLIIAPLIFAIKISVGFSFNLSDDFSVNHYWNYIIHWPLLLITVLLLLLITWKSTGNTKPFYGLKTNDINWKPYWLMLLIMVPLIALASTQPDFQAVYPKLQSVTGGVTSLPWWKKLLFELSYGSDFITIELFFRGFLILGFMKWAGKDAILPMACFYCTIHFGKPLGECISSYFGGILLGIVVYNTRSIFGGLMVHLGIAWLMELGGYLSR